MSVNCQPLNAGANPTVAIPYPAPHAGRRVRTAIGVVTVAVWPIVVGCGDRAAEERTGRKAQTRSITAAPATAVITAVPAAATTPVRVRRAGYRNCCGRNACRCD